MKKVFYYAVIVILGITITTHAEMKLKLSQDITGKVQPTFGNSQMESNLNWIYRRMSLIQRVMSY